MRVSPSTLSRRLPYFPGGPHVRHTAALVLLAGVGSLLAAATLGNRTHADLSTPSPDASSIVDVSREPRAAPRNDTRPLSKRAYLSAILDRNVFDPSSIGNARPEDLASGERETDLNYLLLGTVVAVPSEYSSAWIMANQENTTPAGYGIGDALQPGSVIVAIHPRKVTLRRENGTLEYLTVADPDEDPRHQGEVVFEHAGRYSYRVSEPALALVYEDPDDALKTVRARGRRRQGIHLGRVSRTSPFHKLGLRSRDFITHVNGKRVRAAAELSDALRLLEGEAEFTIKLKRRKATKTLSYEVM